MATAWSHSEVQTHISLMGPWPHTAMISYSNQQLFHALLETKGLSQASTKSRDSVCRLLENHEDSFRLDLASLSDAATCLYKLRQLCHMV